MRNTRKIGKNNSLTQKKLLIESFFIAIITGISIYANVEMYEPAIQTYLEQNQYTFYNVIKGYSILFGLVAASYHGATNMVHTVGRTTTTDLPKKWGFIAVFLGVISSITVASETWDQYRNSSIREIIRAISFVFITYGALHTLASLPIVKKFYEKLYKKTKDEQLLLSTASSALLASQKNIQKKPRDCVETISQCFAIISAILSVGGTSSFILTPFLFIRDELKSIITKCIGYFIASLATPIVIYLMAMHAYKATKLLVENTINLLINREKFKKNLPFKPKEHPYTFTILTGLLMVGLLSTLNAGIPTKEFIIECFKEEYPEFTQSSIFNFANNICNSFLGMGTFYLGLIIEALNDVIRLGKDIHYSANCGHNLFCQNKKKSEPRTRFCLKNPNFSGL